MEPSPPQSSHARSSRNSTPASTCREPLVWLGHRSLVRVDPLPIAVLEPTCSLCVTGTEALERVGRRYTIVMRTPSLSGLRAALEAGLAVGSRTPLLRSGSIEVLGPSDGLPSLGDVAFALHVPRPLGPAARKVAALVRQVAARDGSGPSSSVAAVAS